MARSDMRFREAYNTLLGVCSEMPVGAMLPSESALADAHGVSRTVIRSVLERLADNGILDWQGRQKTVVRHPREGERLQVRSQVAKPEDLEGNFLNWILQFDVPAGTALNVAQLSRDFAVSPHTLQEFLAGLSQFGLVERRAKGGWTLVGFTIDFAVELSELRSVLEVNAVQHVMSMPTDHPVWEQLEDIRQAHLDLQRRIEVDYHEFSRIDEIFHATVNSVVSNRFIVQFQKVISLIFHYHYMWDKRDEKTRNAAAINEHLAIIAALQSRDEEEALRATRRHLKTSMTTLLSSLRDHQLA